MAYYKNICFVEAPQAIVTPFPRFISDCIGVCYLAGADRKKIRRDGGDGRLPSDGDARGGARLRMRRSGGDRRIGGDLPRAGRKGAVA
ncbi:hypothetical protein [Chlorobaculum thiosulfatiphilum]|uniref:hypothetical protein n=1 Tax=Chlorobaculum thiosulfatiphilum TaxID=115852 RepID=UPI001FE90A7A|nr:hypothetical protein [Chlorobaculum thiosulfatiphilum]